MTKIRDCPCMLWVALGRPDKVCDPCWDEDEHDDTCTRCEGADKIEEIICGHCEGKPRSYPMGVGRQMCPWCKGSGLLEIPYYEVPQ